MEETKKRGRKKKEIVKKKILMATSEATPYITTGGLGEVIGALSKALMKKYSGKLDIRVVLPLYPEIKEEFQLEFVGTVSVPLAWRNQYCGIYKSQVDDVIYYFLDNEYYFHRCSCYGQFDDGERFAYFAKSVLNIFDAIDYVPDIIHCNDWQTALIPVYLKTKYQKYENIKSIFTIHNIEYQGKYDISITEDVFDLYGEDKRILEYDGCINLLKGAIFSCDVLTTVSKTYANEIKDDFFAYGLANAIKANSHKLMGILNGIDISLYNPETDEEISTNFNEETIDKKQENKKALQNELGLQVDENIPLIAIVSRLVKHKGIDIIARSIENILKENVQIVVLGKGESEYEWIFKEKEHYNSDKLRVIIDYNKILAKKIYAGADMFLMPSKSEPCGLAQMIASRYGTVPIVREIGGLKDSIFDCGKGIGNGFSFYDYTPDNLVCTLNRAKEIFYKKDDWNNLIREVMKRDFSWENSSKEYYDLYNKVS